MRKEQDLTGRRYGNLTVIKKLMEKEDRFEIIFRDGSQL